MIIINKSNSKFKTILNKKMILSTIKSYLSKIYLKYLIKLKGIQWNQIMTKLLC